MAWCGVLAALSDASEAAQLAGGRYDGRLPGDVRINLRVSGDRSRLAAVQFGVRMSCSDGRRLTAYAAPGSAVPITPAGSFAFTGNERLTTRRRGRRVSGVVTVTASGAFSASGESAAGTTSWTFTSPTLRCSSAMAPYTVYLDGTRGAPFRGARLATGRYAMRAAGRGLAFRGALRAFAPSGELSLLRIRSRVSCRGGGSFGGNDDFERVQLKRGAAVVRRRFRVRGGGGVVSHVRSRLSLRFYRRGSYRVRGTWRVSAAVFEAGRRIDTCRLSKRFSGRFRTGPPNLF